MAVLLNNSQRKFRLNHREIKRHSLSLLRLTGHEGAELSILFVSPQRMRALNNKYRGIDRPTDVLSFPLFEKGEIPKEGKYLLGDIVINPHQAMLQCKEHELSFKSEIRWLLVHGFLHLLGYDHEISKYEERKMRKKELELLEKLGGW